MNQAPVSDAEALDLVCQLMAIPGGSGDEGAVMRFVAERLTAEGAGPDPLKFDTAHKRSPIGGQVGNAVFLLAGKPRAPRRLFAAHTDTVPVCLGAKPVVRGDEVASADPTTGLGADDRAGVGVLLTTAIGLLRAGKQLAHAPLTFLLAVQEERGLYGVRHMNVAMLKKPALAFNFDGGSPTKVIVGATGGYKGTIRVHGVPSHAGIAPEQGVSAIAIASLAVADLVENGWHGLVEKRGKRGTSNLGAIEGGVATNVVAEHATLRFEARGHDRAFRERIIKQYEKAFARAAKNVRSSTGKRGSVVFEGRLDYEAFELSRDEPSVVEAIAALEAEGISPELKVSNGGLDANWLAAHGVPAVTLGCGQRNIHTTEERLDIAQYHTARRVAWRLATAL
ncbi:MAG: M20/M25/M40 family metallo-hydrolase [Lacipirellulaceae bacterium]